jgi:hypothetical protein
MFKDVLAEQWLEMETVLTRAYGEGWRGVVLATM